MSPEQAQPSLTTIINRAVQGCGSSFRMGPNRECSPAPKGGGRKEPGARVPILLKSDGHLDPGEPGAWGGAEEGSRWVRHKNGPFSSRSTAPCGSSSRARE